MHELSITGRLSDVVVARHLAANNLQWVDEGETVGETRAWMTALDISVAPISTGEGIQIVEANALVDAEPRELSKALARSALQGEIVQPSAPIAYVLERLAAHGYVLVVEDEQPTGIITKWDLCCAPMVGLALAQILELEVGLRRLIGTYRSSPIPARPVHGQPNQPASFGRLKDFIEHPRLASDLGFASLEGLREELKHITDLRNDLAHARGPVRTEVDASGALARLRRIGGLLCRVLELLEEREQVWSAFAESIIETDAVPFVCWAGPGAIPLPHPSRVFVLNALNPFEEVLEDHLGQARNAALENILRHYEIQYVKCIGRARVATWKEDSFLVWGVDPEQVLRWGRRFGQRAVFELTEDELLVLDMDGNVRQRRARRQ